MKHKFKIKQKFTLVELLVVIGVMGLLMSMAMPQFTKLIVGNSVNRATTEFSSALSYARTYAISKRREVTVRVFIPENGRDVKAYRLEYLSKTDSKYYDIYSGQKIDKPELNKIDGKKLEGAVSFSKEGVLTFRPSGKLSEIEPFVVDVNSTKVGNDDSRNVSVNPFTGKATITNNKSK